jgi:hypothetical protein
MARTKKLVLKYLNIGDARAETEAGVGIGVDLELAKRRYPGMFCYVDTGPVCTHDIFRVTLYFYGDPIKRDAARAARLTIHGRRSFVALVPPGNAAVFEPWSRRMSSTRRFISVLAPTGVALYSFTELHQATAETAALNRARPG